MKKAFHIAILALVLLGTPALCAWLGGYDEIWEGVKSFPPRTEDWGLKPEKLWNHRCPFSWTWWIGFVAWTFFTMFPLLRRAFGRAGDEAEKRAAAGSPRAAAAPRCSWRRAPFPWWGWLGLVELAVAWTLSWSRFPSLRSYQPHLSYWPLWLGFILIVNALCVKRSGSSPMTAHPARYALSFPLSSLFWWFFEYLNRYVWNWYYLGVGDMDAAEYCFYATLCFASVLPAVCATAALLHTFAPFRDARFYDMGWKPKIHSAGGVVFFAITAALGLCGIVFFPQAAFPLLWLSPLMAFLLVQILLGEKCVLENLRTGDWSLVARFSVAALICGLTWETWNYYAVAKWVYAVPWVHRFQIWEMPIIGFAGYLPFGVECAAVTAWLCPALVENGGTDSDRAFC